MEPKDSSAFLNITPKKAFMSLRFALALIVTLLAALPALASPSCMTHSEAKHVYGRETYLHWTGQHCWGVRHAAVHAKRSARVSDGSLPSGESDPAATLDSTRADTVWPAPPTDYSWADRWPDYGTISPDRWLMELVQFGSR